MGKNLTTFATRFTEHGQITDLSSGFSIGGEPFQIFITTKGNNRSLKRQTDNGVIPDVLTINCKLVCDKTASPLPVPFELWSESAIIELAADSLDLTKYDLYWGKVELEKDIYCP